MHLVYSYSHVDWTLWIWRSGQRKKKESKKHTHLHSALKVSCGGLARDSRSAWLSSSLSLGALFSSSSSSTGRGLTFSFQQQTSPALCFDRLLTPLEKEERPKRTETKVHRRHARSVAHSRNSSPPFPENRQRKRERKEGTRRRRIIRIWKRKFWREHVKNVIVH